MIVEMSIVVFAECPSLVDLAALISMCRGDPHALLVDPPYDPGIHAPELSRMGELREEISLILEYGPEAAAQRPRNCPKVRVIAKGPSDWNASPPILSVSDALSLLRRPLDVMVENRRNDGSFLRKVLPPKWRREFERWERDGAVRIDSEGGLGEMTKRVERAAHHPEEAARIWLLFDRDCRGADPATCSAEDDVAGELRELCAPSDQATRLKLACEKVTAPWPLGYQMLERRAIENYLPHAALFLWAGSDRERRALAEALVGLSSIIEPGLTPQTQQNRQRARRFCFPMKQGLLGDVTDSKERERLRVDERAPIEDRHLSPLYRPLPPDLRKRLRNGFGKNIATLFQDDQGVERVRELDLAGEIDQAERLAIAESIARKV